MLGFEPGAAGSGSKYVNHCAMLPPTAIYFVLCISGFSHNVSGSGLIVTKCVKWEHNNCNIERGSLLGSLLGTGSCDPIEGSELSVIIIDTYSRT